MAKLRLRKSINLGGGARLNLSSKGVGASWGVKGARVTRRADGRTTFTGSAPGTGLSFTQTLSGGKTARRPTPSAGGWASPAPQPVSPPNYWTGFLLNFLLPGLGLFVIGALGWGLAWLIFGLAVFAALKGVGLVLIWIGVASHYRALYRQRWP